MRIAVIGAGFAGIAAGKTLTELGHDVTIFEKAHDVGGVWSASRRYPGLTTQNNKGTYHLSDMPMPASYPEWPTGKQVQAYMASYVTLHGLNEKLRLGTEVTSASLVEGAPRKSGPLASEGAWTVTSRNVDSGDETTETFDFVVVANGIFSEPKIPEFAGREAFEAAGGRVVAPSEVHSLDEVRGRKIAVIGYGKSACDVAASLSDAADKTYVIARQLLWKMPRMLAGVLNYKYLMLSRLGEGLFEYRTLKGVEKLMHGPGKPVVNQMLGSVQGVATRQLKLKQLGLVPDGDFERIARSTVSLVTEGFYEKATRGEITVIRDAAIRELTSKDGHPAATLTNGDEVELDMVVCATGFRQEVPFFDDDIQDRLTDDRGNFELYRQILPHDVPALAFCGYNSSFYSPLSAEVASVWIGALLLGDLDLPPLAERRAQVAERLAWMEERTEGHHARGTNIIPFSMHNVDEMLDELRLNVSKVKKAVQWLLPVDARDYADLVPRLIDRHERRTGVRVGVHEEEGYTPKTAAAKK